MRWEGLKNGIVVVAGVYWAEEWDGGCGGSVMG